jgi:hypothetical protein
MKKLIAMALVAASALLGCATMQEAGWTTLLDGTSASFNNWNRVGDANWRVEGGAIVADKGKGGHLVSKESYRDFQVRAEFWAEPNTNSGVWIRLSDPNKITTKNSYEVNIYDARPEPKYGTGAIVNVAAVSPMPRAAGKWNLYEITAKGDQITVVLNGAKTVEVRSSQSSQGPISLQFGNHGKEPGGAIKWRKVQVRPL